MEASKELYTKSSEPHSRAEFEQGDSYHSDERRGAPDSTDGSQIGRESRAIGRVPAHSENCGTRGSLCLRPKVYIPLSPIVYYVTSCDDTSTMGSL